MRHSAAASPNNGVRNSQIFEDARQRLKAQVTSSQSKPQLQHQDISSIATSKAIARTSSSSERNQQLHQNNPLAATLKMDSASTSSLAKRLLDHQNRMRLLSPGRSHINPPASSSLLQNNQQQQQHPSATMTISGSKNSLKNNANLIHNAYNDGYSEEDTTNSGGIDSSENVFNPFNSGPRRQQQSSQNHVNNLNETPLLRQINNLTQQGAQSGNELARKKIQYFTASAKNFIISSNKLKRFLEPNRSSEVQYALNLFSIDRDNMEKSLRHLEQECELLSASGNNGNSPSMHAANNNQDVIYARLVESLREENAELKQLITNNGLGANGCNSSSSRFELQQMCERLQRQLDKSLRKCTERKNCIKKLYNLVEDKEKEVEELQTSIDRFNGELHQKQLTIQELEEALLQLGRENSDLHTQRNEKRESFDELRQSLMEVQARFKIGSNHGTTRDELLLASDRPSLLARWKTVRDFLLDRHKISNLQREESEQECQRLREELHRQLEIIATLESSLAGSAARLQEVESQKMQFEETIYAKTQVESRLEESNSHSTNLVRKLQTEVRRWQEEAQTLNQSIAELKQRFESDRIEIANSFERKFYELQQTWEQRIQQCSEQFQAEADSKDAIASAKQREIDQLSRQLSMFERKRVDMLSTFEAEKAGSTRAVEESQEIAGEQKRRILALTEELSSVKQQLKTQQFTLTDRSDELGLKHNEIHLITSELNQAKELTQTTKARLNASIEEITMLKREISALQERVRIADFKSENLAREASKLTEEVQSLTQLKIELTLQLESSANAAKKSFEKLKQQITDLTAEVKSKDLALTHAANDASESSETIQTMKLEALRTSHKLNQLESELQVVEGQLKDLQLQSEENKRGFASLKQEKNQMEENLKKRIIVLTEEMKKSSASLGVLEKTLNDERGLREDTERNVIRLEEVLVEKEKIIALNQSTHAREIAWRDSRIEECIKSTRKLEVDLLTASVTIDKLKKDTVLQESRVSALNQMNEELENLLSEKNNGNGIIDSNGNGSENNNNNNNLIMISEQRKRVELAGLLSSKEDEVLLLKSSLLECESNLEKQVKAFEDKSREVEYSNAQCVELAESKARLEEETELLNRGLIEVDAKCRKSDAALAAAKADTKRVSLQLESVSKLAEELKNENVELKQVNEDICERNATVSRDFERVSDQLAQFSAQNAKYEANYAKLAESKERIDDEMLRISNEKLELEHRLNLTSAQLEKTSEKLTAQSKELEAIKLQRINLEESIAESTDNLRSSEQIHTIKLAQLTAENERFAKSIRTLKDENEMLKKSIDGIFTSSEESRGKQSEQYSLELQQLNERTIELKRELKKSQDDRNELSVRIDAAQKRNDRTTLERDQLQSEAAKLREAKQAVTEQLMDLKAKYTGLQEKERLQQEEIDALQTSLHGYQLKCEGLNKDVQVSHSSRKSAETKAGATEAALKTQLSVITAESGEYQRQVGVLSRELDRVSSDLETALRNWQTSRVEEDRLNAEIEKSIELYDSLQAESQILTQELQTQTSRADELQEYLEDRNNRLDELTRLLQESESQTNLHANRAQEFFEVNGQLQTTIESLDEKQLELERENAEIAQERENVLAERDQLNELITRILQERDSLQSECAELTNQIALMKEENQEIINQADTEAEEKVKKHQKERETWQSTQDAMIEEKDTIINANHDRIEAQEKELQELAATIKEREQRITQLTTQQEDLNNQIDERELEAENLRAQLVVLSESNNVLQLQAAQALAQLEELQGDNNNNQDNSQTRSRGGSNNLLHLPSSLIQQKSLQQIASGLNSPSHSRASSRRNVGQQAPSASVEKSALNQNEFYDDQMLESGDFPAAKQYSDSASQNLSNSQLSFQQMQQLQNSKHFNQKDTILSDKNKQPSMEFQQEEGDDEFQDTFENQFNNNNNRSRTPINNFQQQQRSPNHSYHSSRSVSPSQIVVTPPAELGSKPIEFNFSNNRITSRSNINSQRTIDLNTSFGQNKDQPYRRSPKSRASPVTAAEILKSQTIPTDTAAVAELIADIQNQSHADFHQQLDDAEAEIESLKQFLAQSESDLQSMHIQQAQREQELVALQAEHADSLAAFEATKTDLLNQLARTQELYGESQKEIDELNGKLLEMQVDQNQRNLASEQQLHDLTEQLKSSEVHARELQERCEQVTSQFEDSRVEANEIIGQLRGNIQSSEANQLDLSNEIAFVKQQCESSQKDISEKTLENNQLMLEKNNLQEQIQAYVQELQAMNDEKNQSKATLAEYADCIASLQRELSSEKDAAATMKDDLKMVQLAQQDLQIKMEVVEIKTKSYFNMLMKILLVFDSDLDEKVSQSSHSFEQLLSVGISLAKAALKSKSVDSEHAAAGGENSSLTSNSASMIQQQQEAVFANHLEMLLHRVLHHREYTGNASQQQHQLQQQQIEQQLAADSDSLSPEHREKLLALVEQVNAFTQIEANALNDFTF